ncbi:MAG TPA: hypothetical protein VGF06_13890, partial [Terriglobales bacterium]
MSPRLPLGVYLSLFAAFSVLAPFCCAQPPAPPTPLAPTSSVSTTKDLFALWSVETRATVEDNFGHHIANRFYVVELLLNNQLDTKVIITGVGFDTLQDGNIVQIAAADPQAIRGVLLKKNQVGGGASFKHAIAMTGLLATGASGFFKAVGSAATYNRS